MTDIILKQGTGVPSDTDLEVAEVAIDSSSGDMYTKLADGSVKQLNPDGGAGSWNDLTDKPADFPPSDHTHEIDDVNGLQDALDAAGGAPAWDDVTGKPSEFPPASHNHDGVYQPVGDYIGDAPNDGDEYARKNQGWVKLQDHNYTGADAVKLTGDQSVAGHKTWTGVATFGDTVTMRGTLNGDDTANFQNAVTAGSFVKTGGTSGEYLMADGSVSSGPTGGDGGGEFVHIGEAPPADPQEGQQWMEVPASGDATMWLYDGDKWLQQPGGKDGANGANGADGKDGVDGLWTDNGDTSISYTAGNVGIGTDDPQAVFQVVDNNPTAHSTTADADTNMPGMRLWNNAGGNTWSGVWFQNGSHWSGISGAKSGNGWGTHLSFFTHGEEISDLTQATERMRIDADGTVSIQDRIEMWVGNSDNEPSVSFKKKNGTESIRLLSMEDGAFSFWDGPAAINRMRLDPSGDVFVHGNIYKQGGTPVSTAADLIEVLHTLREATKDESTLEGLRDSIGNAVGGLIEKFEAMQSTATQEIES